MITLALYLIAAYIILRAFVFACQCLGAASDAVGSMLPRRKQPLVVHPVMPVVYRPASAGHYPPLPEYRESTNRCIEEYQHSV